MNSFKIAFVAITVACCANGAFAMGIWGNNDLVVEKRELRGFDAVDIRAPADVRYVASAESKVEIRTDSNLIDKVRTYVDGGALVLDFEAGAWVSPTKLSIIISSPSLSEVRIRGSGSFLSASPLVADRVRLDVSGSGDIKAVASAELIEASISGSGDISLEGGAETLDAVVSGSGDLFAEALEVDRIKVSVSGSGCAALSPRVAIEGSLDGSGDLILNASDEVAVRVSTSGTGEIERRR
jgi:hypothetical protein